MMLDYKMMEWTDERVKLFWDYESNFPENYFTYQVGHSLIGDLQKYFRSSTNVLDFGAGPGHLIPHLLNANLKVSALEFSQESIQKLKIRFSNQPNFKGVFDSNQLLASNQLFDVIMVVEVIEHLNDNYLYETASLVKRLLAKDGIVIFTTPNNEDLAKAMILCPSTGEVFHRWQHVRSWTKQSLNKFLTASNFEIVDVLETRFLKRQKIHKINILSSLKGILKSMVFRNRKQSIKNANNHLVAIARLPKKLRLGN